MDELLKTLALLGFLIMMIVEALKPWMKKLPGSDAVHDFILRLFGMGLGVIAVAGGGNELNILTLSPVYSQLNPGIGMVLTGLLVGGFSQGLWLTASLLARKRIEAPNDGGVG